MLPAQIYKIPKDMILSKYALFIPSEKKRNYKQRKFVAYTHDLAMAITVFRPRL